MAEILKTLRKYNLINFTLVINNTKILHLLFLVFIALILEYRYISFITVKYEYYNFTLNYSLFKLVLGKFLMLLSFVFLLFNQSKFIYFTALLLNLFLFIPNIIIYQYTNAPVFIVLLIMLFLFLLSSNFIKLRNIKFFTIKESQKLPILFIIAILSLMPFFLTFKLNIDLRVFTFGSIIYEIREKGILLSNIYTNYLYSPLTNFVLPIIIVFGIMNRKWQYVIFGIISMLYLYAIIPQKGTFMGIGTILLFYFIKDLYNKLSLFLFSLTILLLTTIFFTVILNINMPESIFIRRLFFIPAILNNAYFDIFKDNHIYLSHSVLKYFLEYPYSVEPPFYVSKLFWGVSADANNGIIADGYMNFGIIGSIVSIVFATLILKFIDTLNISYRFLGITYMVLRLFISGALLTSLLTHGLLLLLFIIPFFLKDTNNE